ncbi:MAG TPA: hypothetical protein PKA77_03610 [Chitinophagaceae bacterium]|jgi:hypothetical protein|nr:hypothetical protein [Chitinophagaceae bacterium]HMU57462.1 hypothetical protein [Chitinophagaceae bacterium]
METLLRNDFTAHYGLPTSTTANISISTTAQYFEIEDDEHRETRLHLIAGSGMAAYRNNNSYTANIINYDKFITGLPHAFQQGKERCDLIVHTTNQSHFLLNELKDRKPKPKVRTKSISQLLSSLTLIMNVPTIRAFANTHTFRHCCFFNKQSMSPATITATTAFNRLGTIVTNGLQMSNPAIEALGFEFWEYSGNQVYNL